MSTCRDGWYNYWDPGLRKSLKHKVPVNVWDGKVMHSWTAEGGVGLWGICYLVTPTDTPTWQYISFQSNHIPLTHPHWSHSNFLQLIFRSTYQKRLALYPSFLMYVRKVRKAWSIWWCNETCSCAYRISTHMSREGSPKRRLSPFSAPLTLAWRGREGPPPGGPSLD